MHGRRGGENVCRAPEESSRGRSKPGRAPPSLGYESPRRAACAHRCSAREPAWRATADHTAEPGFYSGSARRAARARGGQAGRRDAGLSAKQSRFLDGARRHSCGLGSGATGPARNDIASDPRRRCVGRAPKPIAAHPLPELGEGRSRAASADTQCRAERGANGVRAAADARKSPPSRISIHALAPAAFAVQSTVHLPPDFPGASP
jgi:hypothetical protein